MNSSGENSTSAEDCAKKPASFFVAQVFTQGCCISCKWARKSSGKSWRT